MLRRFSRLMVQYFLIERRTEVVLFSSSNDASGRMRRKISFVGDCEQVNRGFQEGRLKGLAEAGCDMSKIIHTMKLCPTYAVRR